MPENADRQAQEDGQELPVETDCGSTLGKLWTRYIQPYIKPGTQVSILPAVAALAYLDPSHTYAIVGGGVTALAMWLIFDSFRNRSDVNAGSDIQSIIDMHDRQAQASILNGLQSIGIMEITSNMSDSDLLAAQITNNRCFTALLPSIYQNHHAREVGDNCYRNYIERKVSQIMTAFTGQNEGFGLLAQGLLGDVPLEEAVRALVIKWMRDDVIPAIEQTCRAKILYYKSLENRRDVSFSFKRKAREKREKNEGYLIRIEEIQRESALLTKRLVHASGIIPPARHP